MKDRFSIPLNPAQLAAPPLAMLTDHRYWKQEYKVWRDDIALWQQEHDAMRSALDALEQAIARHGEALRSHAKSVCDQEAALDLHERLIAELETGQERPGSDEVYGNQHEEQALRHMQQRRVHEQMKRDHHRLVAQLEMLDAILSQ